MKTKSKKILRHLVKRIVASQDVHETASILVELGKHYVATQRTFCPEIHLFGAKHIVVVDTSKGSSLELAATLRQGTGVTKSATLQLAKSLTPAITDCVRVVVTDGGETYSWFANYHFDENGRPIFGETLKREEGEVNFTVHREVTQ